MIQVFIARDVPSQNKTTYAHWTVYHAEKQTWAKLIRAQLPHVTPPDRLIKCRITSFRGRLLDFGNLVGGAKPIPDALVHLGYLRDDSPRWFACECLQFQVPKAERGTLIEIDMP
jgi:hypothetical protein